MKTNCCGNCTFYSKTSKGGGDCLLKGSSVLNITNNESVSAYARVRKYYYCDSHNHYNPLINAIKNELSK